MKKYVLILLIFLFCNSVSAVELTEDFEGPCSGAGCGCDSGCGLSYDPYSFIGSCFRSYVGTLNWTSSSHQTSGGVNDSAYFRGVANSAGTGEGCMFFGVSADINDPKFYYRIARRFSSGFAYDMEAKLHYIYQNGGDPINNLFISSNQIRLYINYNGGYYVTNTTNNLVSHSNQFVFSDYAGSWWAYTFYMDVETSSHEYKLWITTEAGAANCSEGTVCTVSDRLEFNNYLYLHNTTTESARDPERFQVGHYINNMESVTTGATTDFDSFAASDTQLTSNVFDSAPTTQTISGGVTLSGASLQ